MDKLAHDQQGGFDFLRLSMINVLLKTATAEFCFVCPEDRFDAANQQIEKLKASVQRAYKGGLRVAVKLSKSHFDPHFFAIELNRFFGFYASLKGCVNKHNVTSTEENGTYKVAIGLKPSAYAAFTARGLLRELVDFVKSNYTESIEISVSQTDEVEQFFEEREEYTFDSESGRYISVQNVDGLIGYTIYDRPAYICDSLAVSEKVILCGRIEGLRSIERKPKDGKVKPNFFKFILSDDTGSINCVFFPSEKTKDKFALLSDGDQIVVDGKIENNTFNDSSTLTMYPRRVSRCTLPDDFTINRIKLAVPERYKQVFPKPYIEYSQTDLFAETDSEMPDNAAKYLAETELCVFDIETTGLDRLNDRITEIGVVRVKNGKLVETFSTLIDPQVHIPERISKMNGITDESVRDAPLLEDVLGDLLKFVHGTVLVGHNIESFDHPFLAHAAAKHNVYFDNKRVDTFTLAKSLIKMPNYKLSDLAARYDVINPNAHRALDDAITTAKVLLNLLKEFNPSSV